MLEFSGKVAIVTGAGSGLGEAIATILYQGGASVVLADIDQQRCIDVAGRLDPEGAHTLPLQTDVSDHRAVEAMVAATMARFDGLHLAVNNAGITGPRETPTAEYDVEAWQRVIATDLGGVFFGMKYQIPALLASGGGAIVNMSSAAGIVAVAGEAPYVAAKHGIIGLSKSVALEYAGRNIRVNAVGPGFIDTPEIRKLPQAEQDALAALHPVGRLGQAEEVGQLVAYLLSEQASFITGSFHSIDGGYTAR